MPLRYMRDASTRLRRRAPVATKKDDRQPTLPVIGRAGPHRASQFLDMSAHRNSRICRREGHAQQWLKVHPGAAEGPEKSL